MRVLFVLVAFSAVSLVLGGRVNVFRNRLKCYWSFTVFGDLLKSAFGECKAGNLDKATKMNPNADGFMIYIDDLCGKNPWFLGLKTKTESEAAALDACLNPTPPPNPVCDAVAVTCPAGQCNGGTFCADIGGTACESQSCPADQQCCVI